MARQILNCLKLHGVLGFIFASALGLRLWGIGFGSPFMYHPDEGVPISISLRILYSGNLDPQFFDWPSLSIYMNTAIYLLYFVVGWISGQFTSPLDLPLPHVEAMAVGKFELPTELWLGRGLVAVVGACSVIWVYLIAQRVSGSQVVGWTAAWFLAIEPTSIKHSQFIRPDTWAIFFALGALFFALKILDAPKTRDYVLAGIALGLAVSCKYNLVFVAVPIFLAHLLRHGRTTLLQRKIYWAALASLIAFFLTTPYALLNWAQFFGAGLLGNAGHYAGGHPGAEGDSFLWYVAFLWSALGGLVLLSLIEAVWSLSKGNRASWVVLSFPVFYLTFISLYQTHFDAAILPVISYVIILATLFLYRLKIFVERQPLPIQWLPMFGFSALVILVTIPLAQTAVAHNISILQPDGREYARVWIESNLPTGSRIALESYSPYIDPDKFVIDGFGGIQDHTPDWYVANGFEYLVFSQGIYQRYFDDPVRYAAEVDRYETLFTRFPQVAHFAQNGYEIRIHKTNVVIPSRRVGLRFGDYGDMVELVGYDVRPYAVGEPLRLIFTWRMLSDKPEPFEVKYTLRDADDQIMGDVRSDLFQGNGWQRAMFSGEWSIPLSASVTPGVYRLQVDVIWTRFAYGLPAQDWAGRKINIAILDSMELRND